jgi:hypothetical protein
MDNRQQLIDVVRRSRKATKKLSKLLQATPLDADAITSCLDQGAIIEGDMEVDDPSV